jgi:hypothetical protein
MTDARKIIADAKSVGSFSIADHVLGPRVGFDQADAIIAALTAAGLTIVSEKQFVEVACMLYCLGATDRVAGRPQNAVPASRQAWRELRAMVEASHGE